jgi:hypothetical protein
LQANGRHVEFSIIDSTYFEANLPHISVFALTSPDLIALFILDKLTKSAASTNPSTLESNMTSQLARERGRQVDWECLAA